MIRRASVDYGWVDELDGHIAVGPIGIAPWAGGYLLAVDNPWWSAVVRVLTRRQVAELAGWLEDRAETFTSGHYEIGAWVEIEPCPGGLRIVARGETLDWTCVELALWPGDASPNDTTVAEMAALLRKAINDG